MTRLNETPTTLGMVGDRPPHAGPGGRLPRNGRRNTSHAHVQADAIPTAAVLVSPRVAVHAAPSAHARLIKLMPQFRRDFRPTTLLVLAETRDAKGQKWLKLSLPQRPNGTTGWARERALKLRSLRRTVVIDLSQRKLRVLEQGKTRYATRVAVGRRGMETPRGLFYITASFRPTERYLGSYAFETSAYSKLSDWPGGGVVGLHGTTTPSLLGKAVSHGCVRMSNTAALILKRLAPTGTVVRIIR